MNNNKEIKDNKYEICWIQICPFDIRLDANGEKKYYPDRNNFPYRLCVINNATEKCIDIKTQQEYDFIKIINKHFNGESFRKINNGKRYGILKLNALRPILEDEKKLADNIISRLQKGEKFPSGNDISNDEYLNIISSESDQEEKVNKRKMKIKIFKRR